MQLDRFPLSTLRSTQVMVVNRFGAAFFFTSAGFLVDIGLSVGDFLMIFSLTWILLGTSVLLYILNWNMVYKAIAGYFLNINEISSDVKLIKFTFRNILINYPFIFNIFGILIPIVSAAAFPQYRGMLLQIGFIFNSVASLLLVFIIEPRFMAHVANGEAELADQYHQELITSKALLLLCMGLISWLVASLCF